MLLLLVFYNVRIYFWICHCHKLQQYHKKQLLKNCEITQKKNIISGLETIGRYVVVYVPTVAIVATMKKEWQKKNVE